MTSAPLDEILRALLKRHLTDAEVYVKRGRSRRLERTPLTETSSTSQERAWAVRAGNRRASFFAAATGDPDSGCPWPEPVAGPALELPEPPPAEGPAWNPPSDFDTPLTGERDGLKLLESLGRELAAELPRARLLRAVLEDGSSESELANSRGLRATARSRVATLYLEAAGPGAGGRQERQEMATLYVAARESRQFHPAALARRLANRLAVSASGAPPARAAGELLLAPSVTARLLAGLLPLLVGPPGAASRLIGGIGGGSAAGGRGRFASERVTLIDNGRLPGGTFESPVDGEGMPTREVVLVADGVFRQPLLAWWQEGAAHGEASGCVRRAGWRDLPTPGPTHLYLKPDPRTPVAALLGAIPRGFYLIDPTGPGRFDLEADRFTLPVCGFAIEAGRATSPVAGAALSGGIGAFLRGIAGVGRDLTFHPLDGMIGAPTVLATGIELGPG